MADCSGGGDVEFGRLDVMPISIPLARCHPLEMDRPPRTARYRPRSDRPPIMLFPDCPEEYYKAFPVNGENLHLRLSKVEKLSFDRLDDRPRDHSAKSANPQTLPGRSLHDDRRRLVLIKSSILRLPLANRRGEKVMPTPGRNHPLREILS